MLCCHWSGTRISGDAETGFDNTRTAATVIRSLIEKDIEIRVVQPMNARSLCRIRERLWPSAQVPRLCHRPRCCWSVDAKASSSSEQSSSPPVSGCVSSWALPPAASTGVCSREAVAPSHIGVWLAPRAPPTGARRAAPLRTAAAGSSLATGGGTCASASTASAACWRPSARPTAPSCDYRISVHADRGWLPVLSRFSGTASVRYNWLRPSGTHDGPRCPGKRALPDGIKTFSVTILLL